MSTINTILAILLAIAIAGGIMAWVGFRTEAERNRHFMRRR